MSIKAIVLEKPGTLTEKQIPDWEPVKYTTNMFEPDDLLVLKVCACGICGSDFRYYAGENVFAKHTLGKDDPVSPNIVLGHEIASTDGKNFYAAIPWLPTKESMQKGEEHLCESMLHWGHGQGWGDREYYPGGYSEQVILPKQCLLEYEPASLSIEQAAMLDVVAVGKHISDRAEIIKGDYVVIIGIGPIGNSVLQIAKSRGASIIGLDTNKFKCSIAKECGCQDSEFIYTPDFGGLSETLHREVKLRFDKLPNKIVDTTGLGRELSFKLLGGLLNKGGIYVDVAPHSLPLNLLDCDLGKERQYRSSCNYRWSDAAATMKLFISKSVRIEPWITHRLKLSEVPAFFERNAQGDIADLFKALVVP